MQSIRRESNGEFVKIHFQLKNIEWYNINSYTKYDLNPLYIYIYIYMGWVQVTLGVTLSNVTPSNNLL